jgi:hypothetical protein
MTFTAVAYPEDDAELLRNPRDARKISERSGGIQRRQVAAPSQQYA